MGNGEARKPTLRTVGVAQRKIRVWQEELIRIADAHEGILRPADAIEWARRHPKSALHKEFEWDDHAAAHQHRLLVARNLITSVMVDVKGAAGPVQMFVSLVGDREQPGGGYRTTVSVLSHRETREQLLAQLVAELQRIGDKCRMFKELAGVFAEIRKLDK